MVPPNQVNLGAICASWCLQLHGRTKSLFSAMRKILRLGDMASGGRRLEQLCDLLGLRAIVQPRADLPEDEARLASIEVNLSTALLAVSGRQRASPSSLAI